MFYKVMSIILVMALLPLAPARAQLGQELLLPKPGTMINLSPAHSPAVLKGMTINPNDPFKFDFIIDRGDSPIDASQRQDEYTKLIKYFLAALAVPDNQQWVNLSPYEKDRIIPETFGQTQMGNDLLAQDYILKQLSASLLHPEGEAGKEFWAAIYKQAASKNIHVPINTFNKVWIVPSQATVYEKGNTVYVLDNHLKVMLEEDYLATKTNIVETQFIASQTTNRTTQGIIRQIILPELEKEINQGKNFTLLRQVYSGMLLATWYKRNLKESILGQLYANQGKVRGVNTDPKQNLIIYEQYLQAFKKGVFNMIKDTDLSNGLSGPRKYFSGGAQGYDQAQIVNVSTIKESAVDLAKTDIVSAQLSDAAMFSGLFDRDAVKNPRLQKDIHRQDLSNLPLSDLLDGATVQYLVGQGFSNEMIRDALFNPDRTVGESMGLYKAHHYAHQNSQLRQSEAINVLLDKLISEKKGLVQTISIVQIGLGSGGFIETTDFIEAFKQALTRAGIDKKDQKSWTLSLKGVDLKSKIIKDFVKFKVRVPFNLDMTAAEADTLIESDVQRLFTSETIDIVLNRNVNYGNYHTFYQNLTIEKAKGNVKDLSNMLSVYLSTRNIISALSKGAYFIIEPIEGDIGLKIPGAKVFQPMNKGSLGLGIYEVEDIREIKQSGLKGFLEFQPTVTARVIPEGVYYAGDKDIPQIFNADLPKSNNEAMVSQQFSSNERRVKQGIISADLSDLIALRKSMNEELKIQWLTNVEFQSRYTRYEIDAGDNPNIWKVFLYLDDGSYDTFQFVFMIDQSNKNNISCTVNARDDESIRFLEHMLLFNFEKVNGNDHDHIIFEDQVDFEASELVTIQGRWHKRLQLKTGLELSWRNVPTQQAIESQGMLIQTLLQKRLRWYKDEGITEIWNGNKNIPVTEASLYEQLLSRNVDFVLDEIIKNAFDAYASANSTGPVLLRVKELSGDYIVEILDNGIGIDFERTRIMSDGGWYVESKQGGVDDPVKEGGLGIGVLWSQLVLQLHGGSIEFLPAKENGFQTKVKIVIPQSALEIEIAKENSDFITLKDNAQVAKKGGVDFNPTNLDLYIKRDGKGMILPISQQDLSSMHINGLVPVILAIKPAVFADVFPQ